MKKNLPVKRNPHYNEDENALDFGEDFNPKILTDDEKVDAFMSKYMDVVDPVERYKKYFESSAKGLDHILRDIKLYYKKLVVQGSWTERKYVAVINEILENRIVLSVVTLDKTGLMFDREQLASQRSTKRRRR